MHSAKAFFLIIGMIAASQGFSMDTNPLTAKQRAIVPIASFTATGDMPRLKQALHDGLDAGLTINEIKEILVQLYAYAGFPRCLNGLAAFSETLDERRQRGIHDTPGPEAGPFPRDGKSSLEWGTEVQTALVGNPVRGGLMDFAPAVDHFLKAHLFGDIFGRDNLDWQSREIATVAALASIDGLESQLRSHFAISMNIGILPVQLRELIAILDDRVGEGVGRRAAAVFEAMDGITASEGAVQVQGGDNAGTAIRMRFRDQGHIVRIHDSPAGKAFIAQLPLTLTLRDFNATEKIGDLPARLPVDGAPDGFVPAAGDFAYYAPWGNLAVFYRPFRYSPGLVLLGKMESGVDVVADMDGEFTVHLTLVE